MDALLNAELATLPSEDLLDVVRSVEAQRRRLVAVDHLLITELATRGVASELNFGSVPALLAHVLRLDAGEARARVRAAEDLGPRVGLAGERLDPLFAEVTALQRDGHIGASHAKVIRETVEAVPSHLPVTDHEAAYTALLSAAVQLPPRQLTQLGTRILAHLNPDGVPPRDEEVQRRRGIELIRHRHGGATISGFLTPACLAMVDAVLDSLSAPAATVDGAPDDRSAPQRRHDALQDACTRLVADGGLPSAGGVPVTVLVTMTDEQLATRRGYATTGRGDLISVVEALELADQSEIVATTLSRSGGVLDVGRTKRCATPTMRLALFARDRGCSFPGCSMPALWTEAHHVRPWQDGGITAVGHMCLLCGFHHRSFQKMGWEVVMEDGVPWWRPPTWVDPERRAIRNTRHHTDQHDPIIRGRSKGRGEPPPTGPPV
ncbi:HNH endonuclease signature motif containing protein [Jatrophihabitans sp. GAS493]|uniref:HNH endonuclease signature motif containing protein n=1 Tax=Jatrophihabitans sp. GAS493 TaxID=1907575 RepID=UPI0012FE7C64|nr:HNH endonuclease signature motif containing protein [Jatrophihabitans sp. GAS493]